jgi:leader peptidase (prepilin peptidase)/N-methyltransferase
MIFIYLLPLIVISIIDVRTRRIPDYLSGLVGLIGIYHVYQLASVSSIAWRQGMTAAVGIFFLMLIVAVISSGGIGGGDIKLATALSLPVGAMGWEQLIFAWIVISLCMLGIILILLVLRKPLKTAVPFGPCLALGYLAGMV